MITPVPGAQKTYGEARKAGDAWDVHPDVERIGSYHARHQAKAHADREAARGAWFGLSADGFGVWVPRTA